MRYVLDTYPTCLKLVPAEPRVGAPGLTGQADAAKFADVLAQAAASCAGTSKQPVLALAAQEAAAWAEADDECCWLTAEQAAMVQRFYPDCPKNDCIGFFVARFEKVA